MEQETKTIQYSITEDIDLIIGDHRKQKIRLRREKKNGNELQHVAVVDEETGQSVMLIWNKPGLKVHLPLSASGSSSSSKTTDGSEDFMADTKAQAGSGSGMPGGSAS